MHNSWPRDDNDCDNNNKDCVAVFQRRAPKDTIWTGAIAAASIYIHGMKVKNEDVRGTSQD